MSVIKSRKHAVKATVSNLLAPSALCLLALSGQALAQTPADVDARKAKARAEKKEEATLPAIKASAAAERNDFKPEQVSSPKFVKPLLDTPQTITVINKELIKQQGRADLSDALRNTPGITFTLGENGNTATGDTVFMRGFDASTNIFVDGIRDLGSVTRDTFNLEQVEVVKGPSGADNGRGAPNGYINLSSKKAQLRDFNEGSAALGTASALRLTTDVNRKLDIGLPGAALRFNGFYDKGDSVLGSPATRKRWGIAPTLALGLGTATRAHLSYLHVEQDNLPSGGIPGLGYVGFNAVQVFKDPAALLAFDIKKPNTYGTLVTGVKRVAQSSFYGALTDSDQTTADMLTVSLEHDLAPRTTLRNVARLARTEQLLKMSNPVVGNGLVGDASKPETWTVARNRNGRDQTNQVLTNQTSIVTQQNLWGLDHAISTGVEFIQESQDNRTLASVGTQGRANFYAPSVKDVMVPVEASGASTSGSTTTVAAYLFDTIELNKDWQLSAGLRAEKYRTQYTNVPVRNTDPTKQAASSTLAKADVLASGKIGLLYKPAENGSIYVSYATSQKPAGSDNFALNDGAASGTTQAINVNGVNLDPQQAAHVELGTKWELLDKQMLVTAALFQSTNKNDLARADGPAAEVIQYGKRSVKGLELGVAGAVNANLQLQAGLAFMNTSVDAAAKVAPGTADSQTGAEINFSPKLSFTSWVSYKLSEGALAGLNLGFGARYTASQATQVNNGAAISPGLPRMPSLWLFDAMASYDVNKDTSVQLNVGNLANKHYLNSVNSKGARFSLGAPRSFNLSANFKF